MVKEKKKATKQTEDNYKKTLSDINENISKRELMMESQSRNAKDVYIERKSKVLAKFEKQMKAAGLDPTVYKNNELL